LESIDLKYTMLTKTDQTRDLHTHAFWWCRSTV